MMAMGTRRGWRRRVGWGAATMAVLAAVSWSLSVFGQDVPAIQYRTIPEQSLATTAAGLRAQREGFRGRLNAVQAEIGRLNLAIDAKRSDLRALDEQVIQAHLNMLAADHLVYEAQRRGLPDLLERQTRAADRRREWERLESRHQSRIEGDASGLLEQLTHSRALAADLVVDWNLANDHLRLLEAPPTPRR